jgi:hypothetical protein
MSADVAVGTDYYYGSIHICLRRPGGFFPLAGGTYYTDKPGKYVSFYPAASYAFLRGSPRRGAGPLKNFCLVYFFIHNISWSLFDSFKNLTDI